MHFEDIKIKLNLVFKKGVRLSTWYCAEVSSLSSRVRGI